MNKATRLLIAMALLAGFCSACSKDAKPEAAAKPAGTDENWEPETAQPKADVDDHAGHDHAPGKHPAKDKDVVDHSGHNH